MGHSLSATGKTDDVKRPTEGPPEGPLVFKYTHNHRNRCHQHHDFGHHLHCIRLMVTREKFAEIQETGRDHQTLVRTNYNFASDDDDDDSDSDDEEDEEEH